MAPMAGVSDFPYRKIVREMGCQLVYTEMVSAKGINYGNNHSEELIDFSREGGLIAVQIFGDDPGQMAQAAKEIDNKFRPDIIDINMGCPAKKIVKTGAGSALMKNPELAEKIIRQVVKAVSVPVTVKMRSGWAENNTNAVEIALKAEKAGAAAVAVHGRTRNQFYRGKADWQVIKEVSENLGIPVIGNGDIFDPQDVIDMFNETGCKAVMIGRGCQGNPWIFKRIIHYLQTGKILPRVTEFDKINMAIRHLQMACDYYGEDIAIPLMRKHLAWYLKGMPNSSKVKNEINQIYDKNKVVSILESYRNHLL